MIRMLIKGVGILLFTFQVVYVLAQETKKEPLYHDLNKADKTKVYDIQDGVLSLQYNDVYGRQNDLQVEIYHWQQKLVAEVALEKMVGLNHFNINLAELGVSWEENATYKCLAIDEVGKKYELTFRYAHNQFLKEITASIFVNPRHIDCNEVTGNVVQFVGQFDGGKAPYTVTWYVLNESRTDFLYQPREFRIQRPDATPSITVGDNPDYYVIMHVEDACGNEQHQVVLISCDKGLKKINTIFVESIQDWTKKIPVKQ